MTTSARQTSLSLSEPSLRVSALRRERDRLLKQIAGKKKELERAARKTEDALGKIRERVGPLVERGHELEDAIHARFQELLAPGRVSKRRRAAVLRIYRKLQDDGLLDYREPDPELPDDDDFAFDGADADEPSWRPAPGGGYSAPQPAAAPGGQPSLRALFKRLAIALHPDRVQNDAEKARRTQLMKEVTRAYQQGDLARLLELEKLWCSDGAEPGESNAEAAEVGVLERTVRELKTQLSSVLADLRALRRSDEFHAAKDFKRFSEAGVDPLAEILDETKARLQVLEEVCELVTGFSAGKVPWAVFEAGPIALQQDPDDDGLEAEILAMLLAEVDDARRRPRARR